MDYDARSSSGFWTFWFDCQKTGSACHLSRYQSRPVFGVNPDSKKVVKTIRYSANSSGRCLGILSSLAAFRRRWRSSRKHQQPERAEQLRRGCQLIPLARPGIVAPAQGIRSPRLRLLPELSLPALWAIQGQKLRLRCLWSACGQGTHRQVCAGIRPEATPGPAFSTRSHEGLPPLCPKGRGRRKRRLRHNLVVQLRDHRTEVLEFPRRPDVEPTNNTSERAVSRLKVQQKISGSFRTESGVSGFAVSGSVVETAKR